jgi:hypothetical protein
MSIFPSGCKVMTLTVSPAPEPPGLKVLSIAPGVKR